jgi:hypothetical protein
VWPAYVEAHSGMFVDGDLEGPPITTMDEPPKKNGDPVRNLQVFDSLRQSMGDTVSRCCEILRDAVELNA